jgi:hypothetical protein
VSTAVETLVEAAQLRDRQVDDRDVCTQSHGHLRGVGAGDAAADHDDPPARGAGDASEQDAAATGRAEQLLRTDLHRQPPGDLAHGREQGSERSGSCTVSYAIAVVPASRSACVSAGAAARCR